MLMLTNGETPNNHLSPLHLLDAVSRWVLDLPGLEDRVAFTSELHQSEMSMLLGNSGAGWFSLPGVQVPQAPNCQPWIEPPCAPPPFLRSIHLTVVPWIGLAWIDKTAGGSVSRISAGMNGIWSQCSPPGDVLYLVYLPAPVRPAWR